MSIFEMSERDQEETIYIVENESTELIVPKFETIAIACYAALKEDMFPEDPLFDYEPLPSFPIFGSLPPEDLKEIL